MSGLVRLLISAYGRSVAVTAPATEALDDLVALLPEWFETERVGEVDGGTRHYVVTEEPGHLLRISVAEALHPYLGQSLHYPLALESLRSDVETWIAARAEGLVFVHAGVVAVEGRAIVLPGRSHSGKTTLTSELVRCGATYLSDEYAVVDEHGLVHAYPRRLSLRGPGADAGGFRRVAAEDMGGVTAAGPVPLGLVLSLTYDPDVGGLDLEPVSRGTAVLLLMHDCVCGQLRPTDAMNALTVAVGTAQAARGRRGEVAEVADQVLDLARRVAAGDELEPSVG